LHGQTAAVEYGEHLETLLSKALPESVLHGEVKTPRETLNWLRAHPFSR
jgi:hypothetical protein